MPSGVISATSEYKHVDGLEQFSGAEAEEHKALSLADQETISVHDMNKARTTNFCGAGGDEHKLLVVSVVPFYG